MIAEFNKWYDNIQEPWRMLTMLGMVTPGFVLLSLNGSLSFPASFVTSFLGFWYLLFLLFLRVGRKSNGEKF